jgi:hypothetical protein
MATIPPWPQHHQRKDCYQFDRRRRARRRELSSEGMGELNRKLWSLGELIEDVENAQRGSYSAALFWEPSQTSEADEATSVLEAVAASCMNTSITENL